MNLLDVHLWQDSIYSRKYDRFGSSCTVCMGSIAESTATNTRYGTRLEQSVQFTSPPLNEGSAQVAAAACTSSAAYCY